MNPIQDSLKRLDTGRSFDPPSPVEAAQATANAFNAIQGNRHLQDGYLCDKCNNKGIFYKVKYDDDGNPYCVGTECECFPIRNTLLRMKKSGLKDIIKDYTFGKYIATEKWQESLKSAAMQYAQNPEGWFFLGGQSGCGKTHLCTAICREFLLKGRNVHYMLWRDDVVRLKGLVNESDEYKQLIEPIKTAEVLYIDDLFKTGKAADATMQRPTPADVNVAFEILNYRYNDPKSITIISSELLVDELIDIDEATGCRIFERANAMSIARNRARNYRLKKAVVI